MPSHGSRHQVTRCIHYQQHDPRSAKSARDQETTHMTDYTSYKTLKIDKRDHVATVTINRPKARNSFNHELLTEIEKIWLDLADDTDVRAVLLTGAGTT